MPSMTYISFYFQAEDGIRAFHVTGVQTCALPICRKQHRYTTKPRSLLKQRKIFNNQRKRPISIYFHSRSIARLMCIYPILPPLVTAKPDTTPNMCLHHDRLDIPSRNMIFRIALPPTSSLVNHCYSPLIDVSFRMVLGIA